MLETRPPEISKRTLWIVFCLFLIVRLVFVFASGYDNFELFSDTPRYNEQSDRILQGNFNLLSSNPEELESLFITAPFYPYFQALVKLVFGTYWILALQSIQIVVSCLSGVFLYKLTLLIWGRRDVANIAAGIFCVFPFTLWWVHTFGQESLFQSFFIIAVYFLFKGAGENNFFSLFVAAVLYSLAFLTKSHILIFAPFILAFIFLQSGRTYYRRLTRMGLFTLICFAFTLPYGLYNLKENGIYVASSSGHGSLFLIGHNDDAYKLIVAPPRTASIMGYQAIRRLRAQREGLTHSETQSLYLSEGITWSMENPDKFFWLGAYNLYYFLIPGVNPNYYSTKYWLFSFVIAFPVYAFAYFGIYSALRENIRRHFWMLGLVLTMIIFSVGFYVQNRFRTVTIEPFYIIYAALPIADLIRRARNISPSHPVQ